MTTRRWALAGLASAAVALEPWSAQRKLEMRETVREMIYHAYEGYKQYAFPQDEVRPLSRTATNSLVELGAGSPTREHYRGVALTLIDSLDTIAMLGNVSEFEWAVRWVAEHVSFDQDAEVSLFETNIRVLGGLLSAHLLADGRVKGAAHLAVPNYRGELLAKAHDIGERLLSAFDGCGKLPRSFVSLRGGMPSANRNREQCTAGVGTLLLEFGTLSRLTLDDRFEEAALCALRLLWSKRSARNLLGNTLDVKSGGWRNPVAGIGAGIDSFYEYALKSYLVFGTSELYAIWNASYTAALTHLRVGPWYGEINMHAGKAEAASFDALQAFWPALQVLAGDVSAAAVTQDAFHSLWRRFRVLPERYDVGRSAVLTHMAYYPLRPELAESTYALYRATGSDRYLEMGAEMVASLNAVARTPAGFAAIKSVLDLKLEDHTPSFFLAETLKYLYLLFDEANFANTHAEGFVFSTEGHLIPLASDVDAADHEASVDALPVSRLRQLITSAGLQHRDLFEMAELRGRARAAMGVLIGRRREKQRRRKAVLREPDSEELVCRETGDEAPAAPTAPAPPPSPPPPPKATQGRVRAEEDQSWQRVRTTLRGGGKPAAALVSAGVHARASPRGVHAWRHTADHDAPGHTALDIWAAARPLSDPVAMSAVKAATPQKTPAAAAAAGDIVMRARSEALALAIGLQSESASLLLEWEHAPSDDDAIRFAGPSHMLTLHTATADRTPERQRIHLSANAAWGFAQEWRRRARSWRSLLSSAEASMAVVVLYSCEDALSALAARGRHLPDPWAAFVLVEHSVQCDVAEVLRQLASQGAGLVVLPEAFPCIARPVAGAGATPAAAAAGATVQPWPRAWPPRTLQGPRAPCATPPGSRGADASVASLARQHRLPILLLADPVAATLRQRAELRRAPEDWELSLAAVKGEADALTLLPPSIGSLSVEPLPVAARQHMARSGTVDGGLQIVVNPRRGVGAASSSPTFQVALAAHGEGKVSASLSDQKTKSGWLPQQAVLSVRQEGGGDRAPCHRPDRLQTSQCRMDADCGVSGDTCTKRRCSAFGYCFSPVT